MILRKLQLGLKHSAALLETQKKSCFFSGQSFINQHNLSVGLYEYQVHSSNTSVH